MRKTRLAGGLAGATVASMAVLGMTAGAAQAMSGQTTGEGSWPKADGTHALRLQADVTGGHVTYMINGVQQWKGTVGGYQSDGKVATMTVTADGQTLKLMIIDNGPGQSMAPDGVSFSFEGDPTHYLDAGNYTVR